MAIDSVVLCCLCSCIPQLLRCSRCLFLSRCSTSLSAHTTLSSARPVQYNGLALWAIKATCKMLLACQHTAYSSVLFSYVECSVIMLAVCPSHALHVLFGSAEQRFCYTSVTLCWQCFVSAAGAVYCTVHCGCVPCAVRACVTMCNAAKSPAESHRSHRHLIGGRDLLQQHAQPSHSKAKRGAPHKQRYSAHTHTPSHPAVPRP